MDEVRLSPFSKSPDSCQREPTDTAVARGNLPSDEVTPVNDRLYGENMVDSTSDVRYSCERAEEINRSMEELCCSIVDSTSEDMGIAQIPDSSGLSSGDTGRNGDLCDLPATKKVGKFRFLGGTSERGDVENDTNGYSEEGLTPKSDGAVVSHSDVNDQEEPATKIRRSSRIRTLEEERKRLKSRQIPCLDFMVECSFTGDGTIDSHLTGSEGGDRISDRTVGVSQQILDICDMSGIRTQQKLDSRSPGEPLGPDTQSAAPTSSVPSECGLKLKSRWLKTAEIQSVGENVVSVSDVPPSARALTTEFVTISENQFISERGVDRKARDDRRMLCDCILSEDLKIGCGDECLNRLLYIECGSRCPCGEFCSNKRFQRKQYARVDAVYYGEKGFGLQARQSLQPNTFIMEYIGEVLNPGQFRSRVKQYAKDPSHKHHYFMALRGDQIIDATKKGNISRFINHSCSPNCETQKWTVNGNLRIGLFTSRFVEAGEELTFDYQFQRYGREAQKCLCGASNCRGYIGGDQVSKSEAENVPNQKIKGQISKRNQFEDLMFDQELEELVKGQCLRNRHQVLTLSRLMVRADSLRARADLLQVLKSSDEVFLRMFVDYHGLSLIWSWMVDEQRDDTAEWMTLKLRILEVLDLLPIPHSTMLKDSKVLQVVQRWALAHVKNDPRQHIESYDPEVLTLLEEIISLVCHTDPLNSKHEKIAVIQSESVQTAKEMASKLLQKWSSLKEYFKIPKKLDCVIDSDSTRSPDEKTEKGICPSLTSNREKRLQWQSPVRKSIVKSFGYDPAKLNTYESGFKHEKRRQSEYATITVKPLSDAERQERRRRLQLEEKLKMEDEVARRQQDDMEFHSQMIQEDSNQRHDGGSHNSVSLLVSSQFAQVGPKMQPVNLPYPSCDSHGSNGLSALHDYSELSATLMAYPAILVLDPNTGGYWWQDQNTHVLVCPATKVQTEAVLAGDFSVVPHFYHDPQAGLIHEVRLECADSLNSLDVLPNGSAETNDAQEFIPDGSKAAEIIAALRKEVAELKRQLREKESSGTNATSSSSPVNLGTFDDINRLSGQELHSKLPPFWKVARAEDNSVYYYHTRTKETSWDPPSWDGENLAQLDSSEDSSMSVLNIEESSSQTGMAYFNGTTRKYKEQFKLDVSNYIVKFLRVYRSPDSSGVVKITSDEDFKYLARKLTHAVMEKELKLCKQPEDLKCTESVISKAKEYVKKYMKKASAVHKRNKHSPNSSLLS